MNQPTPDDLVRAIGQALPGALPLALTSATSAGDLYETYVFAQVVSAALANGAVVTYETVQGSPARQLLFRTSPGQIYSTTHPYSHAVLSFPGRPPLEAHVGVRVAGQSGVLHECDVLVLTREEARNCRTLLVAPRSSTLTIAVEAKFYTTALGIALGREFLGLIADLSADWRCLVSNSGSASIAKLFAKRRDRHFYEQVTPGPKSTNLRSFFEVAFSRYIAR